MLDAEDEPVLEPDIGTMAPVEQHGRRRTVSGRHQRRHGPRSTPAGGMPAQWPLPAGKSEDRDWGARMDDALQTHLFPASDSGSFPAGAELPEPEAINLDGPPDSPSGTGTHPTTALCLTWLDGQQLEGTIPHRLRLRVWILAVAALLLGASRAAATDIDLKPEATRDNAERNHVRGAGLLRAEKCRLNPPTFSLLTFWPIHSSAWHRNCFF